MEENDVIKEKSKNSIRLSTIWKYYLPHIKNYKFSVLGTGLFFAGATIIGAIQPLIFKQMIDIFSVEPISLVYILKPFGILIILLVSGRILHTLSDYSIAYSQRSISAQMREESFARLYKHSARFFKNNFVGSITSKVDKYVSSFEEIYDIVIWTFISLAFFLTTTFIIVFRQNTTLGWVFVVWLLVQIVIAIIFVRKKIGLDIERSRTGSQRSGVFSDIITNILTIKIFNNLKSEQSTFHDAVVEEKNAGIRSWYFGNLQNFIQGLSINIVTIISIGISIFLWMKGAVTPSIIILIILYTQEMSQYVWSLGWSLRTFFESISNTKEIVEIFEQTPDILDPDTPEETRMSQGALRFNTIFFGYADGQQVFTNFSTDIPAGQKVGMVGHSGSGKTTITNLVLRFVDVQEGSITIDGQDIRNVRQDDLRRHISYVPQDPLLFHRTIKENIAYGKPDATDEEIEEAARKARAHDFIMELPKGYDTLVGERGVKLSGGQRQRIAITRVMLQNTPLLILDEATSSLDSISEKYIQEAFLEAMKGRTTIVIAHRLSTVAHLDRIIVLDKGVIVEDGTHAELLAKKGAYAELWQHQVMV